MKVRTVEHVADLRRRPGVPRPVVRNLPGEALDGLATSTALVPEGSDVELDGVVEARGSDVVLTGTVRFAWVGECRRCLREVAGTGEVAIREIFQDQPVEGETWPVTGDTIDLAPVLRETVLLALPLVPLCAEDCAGPDPDRFPTAVARADQAPGGGGDGAAPRPVDPRWAALDDLRFDEEQPSTSPRDAGDR